MILVLNVYLRYVSHGLQIKLGAHLALYRKLTSFILNLL